MEGSTEQLPKKEGLLSRLGKLFGLHENKYQVPKSTTPTTSNINEQIAMHKADMDAAKNILDQISMDPIPLDKPIAQAAQARFDAAKQAIENLQQTQQTMPKSSSESTSQTPVTQKPEMPTSVPNPQTPAEKQDAA